MASAADLIREYKKLLDSDIITQEEFDKKKQEFLAENKNEPHERIECVINGKQMLDEGVITEADFGSIKSNIFSDQPKAYKTDITELRSLRDMLSSGVISQEAFETLKSSVLNGEKIFTLTYAGTLKLLKDKHDKGILDDANYSSLTNKFLNPKTNPYPLLQKNLDDLTDIHKFLDDGLITAEDYAVFENSVANGKAIKGEADISPIRAFKDLMNKGLITEEDFDKIRKELLFGKKNINYIWPEFLEEIADIKGSGAISDEEYSSLKSAYMEGSVVPDGDAFDKIRRYIGLAKEGLFDNEEIDILKDRAFSGVEALTGEKLSAIRDYKKLLDEGTISNDDFKQFKATQLNLGGGKKYVIMDAKEVKKKKKETRKTIVKIVVAAVVLLAIACALALIPKLKAHKAVSDLVSESDALIAQAKYDEVIDRSTEIEEELYADKLTESDKEKLLLVRRYAGLLEQLDFTNGGEGVYPDDIRDYMEDFKDYGIMPKLYKAFQSAGEFESITNEIGKMTGYANITETVKKKKKTESGETEYEDTSQVSQYSCEGELCFGFTKADENADLTEDNLIPSAKISFNTSLMSVSGSSFIYTGTFPLDQPDNFIVKQASGNATGTGSYNGVAFIIEFGDKYSFTFNGPSSTKRSSSSSSSRSSRSSSSTSSSSSKKQYSDDSEWKDYDYDQDGQINDSEFQDALGDYLTEHGY